VFRRAKDDGVRLRDISLATRITFGALLLVAAGGVLWISDQNQRSQRAYLRERTADLETALDVEKVRLEKTIASLKQDTVFLANVPPISGIMRATANHGFDPRDKNSYAKWEARLQDIFAAFLRAHPDYSQARYIRMTGSGRELIRVERQGEDVAVTSPQALRTKDAGDYSGTGTALAAGHVYLSDFLLAREAGKTGEPSYPMLRAVTPVFDAGGRLFGMVELNLDARALLASASAGVPPGVRSYVANRQGRYLYHFDLPQAFSFEPGDQKNISTDFPILKPLVESGKPNSLKLHQVSGKQSGYLAAARMVFDADDTSRILLLAYFIPAQVAALQTASISLPNLAYALLVMTLLSAIFLLILRRTFLPLRRITAAAREIAAGDHQLRLTKRGNDEIGELSDAMNAMLDSLADHDELKRERDYRKRIIETTHDGYWLTDTRGILLEVNQGYADISGYSVEELVGMHISQLEAQEKSVEEVRVHMERIISQGYDIFETRHRHKNGLEIDIEVSTTYMSETQQLVVFCRDISERKRAEEVMRVAAAAFETHDAIVITDAQSNIIRVNRAFTEITGYTVEDVLGKNPRIMSSGRQDRAFYADMWQHLLAQGSWAGEIWDRRKSGEVYPKWMTISAVKNTRGETTQYVAIFSDISARKQAEEEIRNLAFYDALTKLPNRRLLMDRFRLALSVSVRSQHYGAVLFLDMDRFKVLNDTLGHNYGDMMLVEVAQRIQSCVREMDTVARLGGDEFVVLLEELDPNAELASQKAALVAEKIREALHAPYCLKDNQHHSSPSIGVCLYCGTDESVDDLLKYADMAMYQAKDSGRNAVRFFDPVMQHAVEIRAAMEADLRHAVASQQLELYYQIQMDSEHRPLGAEALVRWRHPKRGMVSPAQFIPIAEESSLILDLGGWVMDTACRQLAEWAKDERTRGFILAVNVSSKQFRQHDFVETVAALLQRHGVDAACLKLELTESVVLEDVTDVVAKMHGLKALGVRLSLDDFGTGYSSLSYLKSLPLDQIKIDQSFVRDITLDQNDAMLVITIIDMAQNFHLNVIAEGVETEAQLSFLKQHNCMAYQGYYFSKPVPIEEFDRLIRKS
jgi:diguanylate cyclase (GGDEF)-like protein/PAS domain S-box-containing protein